MVETITQLLADNGKLIAAIAATLECVVAIINIWRKFFTTKGVEVMASTPSSHIKSALWILNPVNVFRKL